MPTPAAYPRQLTRSPEVLCAAIDIGSNTTRVLVAEPQEGQLRKVMEQRAYTRIGKDASKNGTITAEKIAEVAEVVTTQVRLAGELGAEVIKIVATAAIREAKNRDEFVKAIEEEAGIAVEVLSEEAEGRLAFLGATKSLGHPVEGTVAVVDVGGGSSEVIFGTLAEGVTEVRSWKIGSGSLTEEYLSGDPPSASEIRALRDAICGLLRRRRAGAPGSGRGRGRQRHLAADAGRRRLEYETLERAVRVLSSDGLMDVAKRFELDPRRVQAAAGGRAAAGEALGPAGPAAADRQGRPAGGRDPGPAQRQRNGSSKALRPRGRQASSKRGSRYQPGGWGGSGPGCGSCSAGRRP